MFVSHHINNTRMDAIKLARVDREELVFELPDPRITVLNCGALSWAIQYVGPATMPGCTNEIHHASFGAQGRHGLFDGWATRAPFVGPRYDSCCTYDRSGVTPLQIS